MHVRYHKPRLYKTSTTTEETKDYTRISRTHTVDKLKDMFLVVPSTAMIHPSGILDVINIGKNAALVAMFLTTLLNTKEQKGVVEAAQATIAKYCNLSLKTVGVSIELLEDAYYIDHVGKQKYKISPKLAWYGNQVDWAIALRDIAILENRE